MPVPCCSNGLSEDSNVLHEALSRKASPPQGSPSLTVMSIRQRSHRRHVGIAYALDRQNKDSSSTAALGSLPKLLPKRR